MELLDIMKNLNIRHSGNENNQQFMRSVAADIDNVPTEIVYVEFVDKTLLILSQYDNIGSLLTVQKDQVQNNIGKDEIYSTKIIFGSSGEELLVAVRYLAEAIKITKPLCIFINLKSYDIETVKACKDIILDIKAQESKADNN